MNQKTVVVAMSGGVDSSVAAALLKAAGYNTIGITLQIWPEGAESDGQGCCSIDAVEDARRVANALAIPHYVMNMRDEFESTVIADFIEEYARGRTPNPCVRCNEFIKFKLLLERAAVLGADFLATGHYARIRKGGDGKFLLKRSAYPAKDQSYVLYTLGQAELSRMMFPLGSMSKEAARAAARRLGLTVWEKADSQEICFTGKTGYRDFFAARRPDMLTEGSILNTRGEEIGRHNGSIGFTPGQRKGIKIAAAEPLYVVGIDAVANTITVGSERELYARSIMVDQLKWVAGDQPGSEIAVTCKVRYNMRDVPVMLRPLVNEFGQEVWEVNFAAPERAPAPGQAAVFYSEDVVLGGGTIASVQQEEEALA